MARTRPHQDGLYAHRHLAYDGEVLMTAMSAPTLSSAYRATDDYCVRAYLYPHRSLAGVLSLPRQRRGPSQGLAS